LLGVASFSLTLPVTRIAVTEMDPTFIASGRAIVAAALAAFALLVTRSDVPAGRQWLRLLTVACGVVVGFPLLATWAMLYVPAAHGAVITGLLPLVTALFAAAIAGERPKRVFWVSTLIGSAAIVSFSLWSAGGHIEIADLLLVGAVASASYGYAEGARLSKELGAWQTISWALIVAVPIMAIPAWQTMPQSLADLSGAGIASFAYVSIVSMYLGFFAWYRALAMGGIASIGQLQLLQPFMTMVGAMLILGEQIQLLQCAIALVILACVVAARKAN
jgi:drug/metabolite transporter (DMT)-like permease